MRFSRIQTTLALAMMAAVVTLSNAQDQWNPDINPQETQTPEQNQSWQDPNMSPESALAPEADTLAPEVLTPAPEVHTSAPEVHTSATDADILAPDADTPEEEAEIIAPVPDPVPQPPPAPPAPPAQTEPPLPPPPPPIPAPETQPPAPPMTAPPTVAPTLLPSTSGTPSLEPSTSASAIEALEPASVSTNVPTDELTEKAQMEKQQAKEELVNETKTGNSSSGGMKTWTLGVMIMGIVGAVMVALVFVHNRSKRHRHEKEISSDLNQPCVSTMHRHNNGYYEDDDDMRALDIPTPKNEIAVASFSSKVDNKEGSRSPHEDMDETVTVRSGNSVLNSDGSFHYKINMSSVADSKMELEKDQYIFDDDAHSEFCYQDSEVSRGISEFGNSLRGDSISSSLTDTTFSDASLSDINTAITMDFGRFSLDSTIQVNDQQHIIDMERGFSEASSYHGASRTATERLSFDSIARPSRASTIDDWDDSECEDSETSPTGYSYSNRMDSTSSLDLDLHDDRISLDSIVEPELQTREEASFISYGLTEAPNGNMTYGFSISDGSSRGFGVTTPYEETSVSMYRFSEEGTI